MRSALRQRDSDLQYREVADQFARLDIHPGYLTELTTRQPENVRRTAISQPPISNQKIGPNKWLDYFSLGAAIVGLSISILVVGSYLKNTVQTVASIHEVRQIIPDPNITRIDGAIHKLSLALVAVVARIEAEARPDRQANSVIAQVVVQKANLRIAPRKNASAVMAVSSGTKLLVDTTDGDWLRIYAPSGELLWIARQNTSLANVAEE